MKKIVLAITGIAAVAVGLVIQGPPKPTQPKSRQIHLSDRVKDLTEPMSLNEVVERYGTYEQEPDGRS